MPYPAGNPGMCRLVSTLTVGQAWGGQMMRWTPSSTHMTPSSRRQSMVGGHGEQVKVQWLGGKTAALLAGSSWEPPGGSQGSN
jgi:hypothetical protein